VSITRAGAIQAAQLLQSQRASHPPSAASSIDDVNAASCCVGSPHLQAQGRHERFVGSL